MEKGKILKIVYPDSKKRGKRIEPAVHFPAIMDYIERDAEKKFGRDVGPGHSNSGTEFQSRVHGSHKDANMGDSAVVSKAGRKK